MQLAQHDPFEYERAEDLRLVEAPKVSLRAGKRRHGDHKLACLCKVLACQQGAEIWVGVE